MPAAPRGAWRAGAKERPDGLPANAGSPSSQVDRIAKGISPFLPRYGDDLTFSTLIGIGIALIALWIVLAVLVLRLRTPGQSVGDLLRVVPASLRLAGDLYRDSTLPRAVRWRLRIAVIYNIQPVNLIPDVVPVIGFADNIVVLVWALRSAVRIAGRDAVGRHWKGSRESLAVLYRLLRLTGLEPDLRPLGEEPA